jgi:uncharacterized protein YegP (UPF0339 family)
MNKFYINKTKNGLYYFTFTAKNGNIVAQSGVYNSIYGCENGIYTIKDNAAEAVIEDLTDE